jgi:hypothetical protein
VNLTMSGQTVSALIRDQQDRYASQERGLRERGHAFLADYLRDAQSRLANLQTQILNAQEPSAIREARRQSLAVADDSAVFMASQMEL